MGRPKVKIIDDSIPEEKDSKEVKKPQKNQPKIEKAQKASEEVEKKVAEPVKDEAKTGKKSEDSLVAKLKEELGIEDTKKPIPSIPSTKPSEKAEAKKPAKKEAAKITRSKKYLAKLEELNTPPSPSSPESPQSPLSSYKEKTYKLNEALDLVKKASYSKFTGTLEAHINTISTGIRGTVSLPFATGKKLRVAAFGKGAETSGADIIGDEKTLEAIKSGKMSFDVLVTTPEWMPKFAPLARILGPRGLMPNPKNGTIAANAETLKKAVESYLAGKTEYKTESKAAVIHLALGKLDQPNEELAQNIKTLMQTIGKSRVKKITLAPTMGPSVKLDLSSL